MEGRNLSLRQTQYVVKDMEIGKPINSDKCSEAADGVARESVPHIITQSLHLRVRESESQLAKRLLQQYLPTGDIRMKEVAN